MGHMQTHPGMKCQCLQSSVVEMNLDMVLEDHFTMCNLAFAGLWFLEVWETGIFNLAFAVL
jgi:hypothetical protein